MTRIFFFFTTLFLSYFSFSQSQMQPFPIDWEQLAEAEFNLSHFLDKPAGKDGFIRAEGGHFIQPNGERFRIWGVNLTGGACFPEKTEAPKVARFLAAMGINAVRFHFLDSNWGQEKSIFDYSKNHTQSFHPEQIDKLDFFVSELKKQGVYSNFNLNVGRNYREGDNVAFHEYLGLAKGVTLFNQQIIQLQKDFAFQLLSHKNEYTGNEYRNEPALAFVEIVNENSLVEAWFTGRLNGDHNSTETSTWSGIPEHYANELTLMYNRWLKRAISPEQIKQIRDEIGISNSEAVPRLRNEEFDSASDLRFNTEARFIIYTENAFYYGMYRYLKESVRARQLIAANSDHNHYKSGYALLSNTAKLDFVDGHVYWQHPNYFTDSVSGKRTFKIENTPMVNEPTWSTIAQLSRSAVKDKPYTVSETNHPYPNQFSCEGFVSLGAYALFQDWDGIYFYTFEHDDPTNWKTKRPNYFDILHDPVKMSSIAAGAAMFHRVDVQKAKKEIIRNVSINESISGIRNNTAPKPFFLEGFDLKTPLLHKTRLQFNSIEKNDFQQSNNAKRIVSDTNELIWDVHEEKGAIKINTPKTQALIGFTEKTDTMFCDNLELKLKNEFAAISLVALDNKAISESDQLLLSVGSSSVLTGAKFNKTTTSLDVWGELPFTIESVQGRITLNHINTAASVKIYALDGGGQKISEIPVKSKKKKVSFKIGEIPTVWYLIEK